MKMRLKRIFYCVEKFFIQSKFCRFSSAVTFLFILSSCSQTPAEYVDNSSRVYGKGGNISVSRSASQPKPSSHNHFTKHDDGSTKDNEIWSDESSSAPYDDAEQFENYDEMLGGRNKFELSNPMGDPSFAWPVNGRVVKHYNKAAGVEGINIGAALNAPVRASANGRVIYVGEDLSEYGKLVIVRHDGDILTAYGHLNSFMIKKGGLVKRGQILGAIGQTGDINSPQLHFSIRKDDKTINPEVVL